MKKKLLLLVAVMIAASTFAQTPKSNWQTTNADYNNPVTSTMFSLNSRDSTNFYFVKLSAEYLKVYHKDSLLNSIPWVYGVDYKKINCQNEFLEIHIFSPKNKGDVTEKSYFFVKGIELRKLTNDVNEEDVFQVKIYQNEFLFEFKNGDYGRYVKNIFYRYKNPKT